MNHDDLTRPTPDWLGRMTTAELESVLTDDPYPLYTRLRQEMPVVWIAQMKMWLVTRFEDVRAVGLDSRFHGASDPAHMTLFGEGNVLSAEGDQHTTQRAYIDPKLRKPRVAKYIDALVDPIARDLLNSFDGRSEVELVTEYFEAVSVRALGNLLGLESISSTRLQSWFHGLSQALVNKSVDEEGVLVNREAFDRAEEIKKEIRSVVGPLIEHVTIHPNDSSISHWVHDGTEGSPRTADELYPTLFVVLLGAMQEPGHAGATAMLAMLLQPDLLKHVVAERVLVSKVVEEGLRWVSPIGIFTRQATEDLEVGGQRIAAGDIVACSMGSANRDETRWDNADEFDIGRPRLPHIAFGAGIHACAGSNFGREVEKISLNALLDARPALSLSRENPPLTAGWFFRSVRALTVKW